MVSVIAARKSRNMSVAAVAAIGVIIAVVGAATVTIRGAPFRGPGLGTVLLVVGIVLLLVAALRYTRSSKPSQ
ncbi:MAG TPA: hypothetical protein VEC02_01545 [Nitrososphaerales archaeon]|nr:hypothetical protein [Nitrososphaerales archaeon]